MAGRFPGAPSVDDLWSNLSNAVEGIRRFDRPGAPPRFVGAEGTVDGIDRFDAEFFGLTPREAEISDPQHRVALECAWEAFESAGYDPAVAGAGCGVFLSSSLSSYLIGNLLPDPELVDLIGGFGLVVRNDKDFAATTISYRLGLTGPSVAVGSACSSSLVAVHLACQSLQTFESDLALAGGVSLLVPQGQGYVYDEDGIYSPDGRCRAFDAEATGTVGGSGAAVVLLKRLDDALRDGDQVRAVILGSAVNNDGAAKLGFAAPSPEGQAAVIAEAHAVAGVDPGSVGFVEAHGTGTPLGDAVEVEALRRVLGDGAGTCTLGSLKTAVGHLDAAAGAAGLVKAALALEREMIPPTLHFTRANPRAAIDGTRFRVNARAEPWSRGPAARRAGVSAFGIGGTNAHVVLEEAPVRAPDSVGGCDDRPWRLLPLSARGERALDAGAERLAERFAAPGAPRMQDAAWTLAVGRRAFEHRCAVVARTVEEAAEALRAHPRATGVAAGERPVVFAVPGQGAQHARMALDLRASDAAFRRELDVCAEALEARTGIDLEAALTDPGARPELAHPALAAVEIALARTLAGWGVEPDAIVGHSTGELAAAAIAGVFTTADALAIVAQRAQLLASLPPGALLAVAAPATELALLLGSDVAVACDNAPDQSVVAGAAEAVERLAARLAERGVQTRRLEHRHAFHTQAVEPVAADLMRAVAAVPRSRPLARIASSATGGWLDPGEATDPGYWARQAWVPVRFREALEAVLELPAPPVILEVGPSDTLTRLARRHPRRGTALALACLPSPRDSAPDQRTLLEAVGRAWTVGARVDWAALQGGGRRVPLPTYAWQRRRYWIEAPRVRASVLDALPQRREDPARWGWAASWRRAAPLRRRRLPTGANCLVLSAGALGDAVAIELEAQGLTVMTAVAGERFERLDRRYVLRPDCSEDFARVVAELSAPPVAVVHAWGATEHNQPLTLAGLDEAQRACLRSVLALAQSLGQRQTRLVIVTCAGQDVLGGELNRPERALAAAAAKALEREQPALGCTALDVEPTSDAARRIVAELCAAADAPVVAHRGGHRWVPDVAPFELAPPRSEVPVLRPGGTYLVCGGLGGVGLALAERLGRAPANLVLTGRSTLPPQDEWDGTGTASARAAAVITRLRALEAAGARVTVARADITSERDMAHVVAAARQRFGPLAGVVHAAGVVDDGGVIERRDWAATERSIAAKVRGALVLDRVLDGEQPDWVVACSSIGTALSGLKWGEVGYLAGNEFLNAWACRRSAAGLRTHAIGWTDWREAGMWADAQERLAHAYAGKTEPLLADLLGGLSTAEGQDVFARVVAAADAPAHLLISTRDLPALLERQAAFGPGEHRELLDTLDLSRPEHARPASAGAYVAPDGATERELAAIWRALLGVDRVGVDDSFFELGGDSLLALRFLARLRESRSVMLPITSLFESPTLGAVARAVDAAVVAEAAR